MVVDGVCDAFLCLCHPHIRPMGVKCQHEIIRCLKAFMNNKVSHLAVFKNKSKSYILYCNYFCNVTVLPLDGSIIKFDLWSGQYCTVKSVTKNHCLCKICLFCNILFLYLTLLKKGHL